VLKVIPRHASEGLPAAMDHNDGLHSKPRLPGRLLVAAVALAALAAAALFVDLPIAQWMKNHGLPGELRRLVRLAEVFGWGGTVALLILTAATLDRRGWRVIPWLAACAFGAGLIADCLKLLVARLRPGAAELSGSAVDTFIAWLPAANRSALGRDHGYALQSFPSAHAATAVGLAIGLSMLYPRGKWLFAAFALLAAVQRIEAQAHFCSDVLAGAAVGCLVSAAVANLSRYGSQKPDARAT
jgi:membrane-associated phospholipid phosphatase